MKFDNRINVYKIWIRKFLTTIVFTLLVIAFGFSELFENPVLGIHRSWYLSALALVYVGLIVFNYLLRPHYVSLNDNGEKIILRYYPVRIFNRKKSSIEIPKQNFVSWETQKFFYGNAEILYLHGKFKTGVARYPGVSLSAVNPGDREKIKKTLNEYVDKKYKPSKN